METSSAAERVSRVIFEYAAHIGQAQDIDTLLKLNADMARDLVDADRCSIWLVDAASGQLHTKVAHGVGEIRVGLGHGLVGACVAQGEPIVVNDTSVDSRFLGHIDHTSGYVTHSVLVIPLRGADATVIGAFQALNKPGGFTSSDVSLLGLAGSYSAGAIETQRLRKDSETARLLLHELEIAREVQAKLVPEKAPKTDYLDCAAYFRPAKLVGGDYYDFIQTPNGALAFTIGDVSGKGIPAAVLMASIQASLRMPLLRGPDNLTGLVGDVNQSVYVSSSSARYSTLFCGLIDPVAKQLLYVNAGQCSPMLFRWRHDGVAIERLETGGPPIGLLPIGQYEEAVISLEPGDLLVCFSDGISEATNEAGEIWQESEIETLLSAASDMSAQEVSDRLVGAADSFTGAAEQADDMTVVAFRVLG